LPSAPASAKVQVKLEIWPEMIHVWQLFASFLPQGQEAVEGIGRFIRERTLQAVPGAVPRRDAAR
jgi:acetyl esterase/lipase